MTVIACPNCGTDLSAEVEASLPEETDLTLSLEITPGQLVMAKTVAGVLENWAAMQVEIGKSLGSQTEVFIAGLSYENDRIAITTRIVNAPAQGTSGSAQDGNRLDPKGAGPVGNADAPKETQHD